MASNDFLDRLLRSLHTARAISMTGISPDIATFSTSTAIDFTVVIPTYNGAQRLPEVLARLRTQTFSIPLTWEVIVIDNNSQDGTAKVVEAFQANFPCPLRCIAEPQQGLAFARRCGLLAAQSEWVGFLDDDNLPDAHWIEAAYEFARSHPQVGAIASRICGEFEVPPAAELTPILPFLALTDRGIQPLLYQPQQKILPPGAGLVVRKSVWLAHVPAVTILAGRIGGNMLAGEDIEALGYIQRSGWEIWYNPAMQIWHKIPAWRLERAYLLSLFRGIGLSRHVTRMVCVAPWQRPWMMLAYLLNDLRK
ncbi:MAG TPA: hormogonium polysaccharide biosynthesis glycosyltransferase HpsE, partial [Allocoleopsis sp.]